MKKNHNLPVARAPKKAHKMDKELKKNLNDKKWEWKLKETEPTVEEEWKNERENLMRKIEKPAQMDYKEKQYFDKGRGNTKTMMQK